MSGGYWGYKNDSLQDNIFNYCTKGEPIPNVFEDRELSELVFDVFELLHCFDWYMSEDTCEETWINEKNEFKKKWLTECREERIRSIVNTAINELKTELYHTFEIQDSENGNS